MKKIVLGVMVLCVILASCTGGRRQSGISQEAFDGPDSSGTIKINYVAENRFFNYNHSSPLTMPDGTIIKAGDLKPFWQWVENQLGISLEDVTTQSRAPEIIQTQSATGFQDANIYGGNAIAEDLINYGTQGYFLELGQFVDNGYLPNFKKYLENNGNIREMITAFDGGIYYVPYVAEIGYFARAFLARQSWVTALLDGNIVPERETAALTVAYSGFWTAEKERHALNVIDMQNEAASNRQLNFTEARDVLLRYISSTYPDLAKPSDLFLGSAAKYDIDELIALWRVIKLAPNTLSKLVTGAVVPGADIVPYFFRQTSYRECLLRLANYFNGQRVFGSDSYDAKFYLDKDGELQFSYAEDNFLDNILPLLKKIYNEGLIAPDFATLSLRDNFRNVYFGGDLRQGHNKFGFMTFDFIPSTTAVSLGSGQIQTDVEGMLPPLTRIPGVKDNFVHFVENTRVIKNDGWSISSVTGGEKLRQCLSLIDFMFTEKGSTAQNFGMPEMIDEESFIGSGGIAYPKMNSWFNEQAALYSNGDGALFSRNFIGFNFPIGYEKSIGFEQQFTSPAGERTWDLYEGADVLSVTYNETSSPYFSLVPPVFSLSSQLSRQLLATNIGATQVDMIFNYITTNTTAIDQIKEAYNAGRIVDYIEVYRDALALMSR